MIFIAFDFRRQSPLPKIKHQKKFNRLDIFNTRISPIYNISFQLKPQIAFLDSQIGVSTSGYGRDRNGMMVRRWRLSYQRVDNETCGHLVHCCSSSNHAVATAIVTSDTVGRVGCVHGRLLQPMIHIHKKNPY